VAVSRSRHGFGFLDLEHAIVARVTAADIRRATADRRRADRARRRPRRRACYRRHDSRRCGDRQEAQAALYRRLAGRTRQCTAPPGSQRGVRQADPQAQPAHQLTSLGTSLGPHVMRAPERPARLSTTGMGSRGSSVIAELRKCATATFWGSSGGKRRRSAQAAGSRTLSAEAVVPVDPLHRDVLNVAEARKGPARNRLRQLMASVLNSPIVV
jgi:hypothetical protein